MLPAAMAEAETVERLVEKEFSTGSGARLKLDICQGPVRIDPSPDNRIHLRVRESVEANNDAEAEKALRDLALEFGQEGTEVHVKARFRRSLRWAWEKWPPVALACEIKVPRACALDLIVRDGDLNVADHAAALTARVDNGAVFTGEIAGPVSLECRKGDVSVTACQGELIITAKSGNVTVGRCHGPATIRGSGGLIEVQSVKDRLRIEADGADIKVAFAHPCREPAVLRAAGGDIEAIFDVRDAFTLKASSSHFGAVTVRKLPLVLEEGKTGDTSLLGTLNGGGAVVELEASGGSVRLVGREP